MFDFVIKAKRFYENVAVSTVISDGYNQMLNMN